MATVFFLEINYYGDVFRFSTYPIDLIDSVTGDDISFEGGLDEVDYNQQSKLVGYNLDQDSLSLELHFKGINWVAEWIGKRTLDGSNCILYLGNSETTKINELEKLAVGRVHDSIFGYPDKIIGWTSFSIENNQASQGTIKVLPDHYKLDNGSFLNLDPTFNGAISPLILGTPKTAYWIDQNAGFKTQSRVSGSPVQIIKLEYTPGVLAPIAAQAIIAYGRIEATEIKLYNNSGWARNLILIGKDSQNREYSYVDILYPIASSTGWILNALVSTEEYVITI